MPDPIIGISSMATRQILAELAQTYEARTGRAVAIRSIGGVEAAKRVRAGEAVDVVVLAAAVMARLETEGHLVAGSSIGIVRSGIAAVVRAGTARPAFDNEEAVKAATLAATRVCYSSGPSGDHLKQLWMRWGLETQMADRAMQTPPGVPVASFVADGKADLGFQQLSELLDQPGIAIVGPLPASIQAMTVFTAGVARTASAVAETRALIAFLASSDAAPVVRRCGMEPV